MSREAAEYLLRLLTSPETETRASAGAREEAREAVAWALKSPGPEADDRAEARALLSLLWPSGFSAEGASPKEARCRAFLERAAGPGSPALSGS